MTKPNEQFETLSAFARRLGKSKSQVSKYKRAGMPVASDGSVPIESAMKWLKANVSSLADGQDGETLTRKRAQKLDLDIERARLALEQERGNLVDKRRAERMTLDLANQVKNGVQAWVPRAAPEIAGRLGTDPHETERVLNEQIRSLLQQMSDDLRRFGQRGA